MIHRRLFHLAGSVKGPIAACVALGFLVSGAYVAQALLLAAALAALVAGEPVLPLLAWAFAVIAARGALLWAREVVTVRAGALVRARLRDRLVGRLAELGPAHLVGTRTGQVQTTLVDGVEGLDPYFSRYLPQVVVTFCVPVALVGWLFTVEPRAAAVLAVAVAGVLTIPRLWDATLLRRGRARWTAFSALAADYLEAMQGMATLRAFGAVHRLGTRLADRAHALYLTTMRQLRISLVETGISAFLVQAGTVGAILVGGESLFLILLVSVECFRPVRQLSEAWHAGYLGITAVDGIEHLLEARPAVPDEGRAGFPSSPEIRFEGVGFTYPGAARPAVSEVSFTVKEGQTLALVGPSGAGKSTLAALLQRHHDPSAGRITIGGVDVRELSLDALRTGIAVVAQDTYLFHGTIADNLRLARPEATDEELAEAARRAGAHDFVTALPDGYGTRLGERGATLSGGQRQRLAIARALLTDAPILILDEATSHVDLHTEQAMNLVRQGRTCLVIAHRLATVRDADQTITIDDGTIIEGRAA